MRRVAVLAMIAAAAPLSAQDMRYTPGPAIRPTTGIALPLGKCVNMANMLEPPREGGWGGRAIEDGDFPVLRKAGFASIRLPVGFAVHADANAPYAIDPAFLARVHHVVDRATASGLNVILDLHNYDALMDDPEGQAPRFAAIWRQVAASFAGAPPSVWFELINEPHGRLTDANLPAVLAPALAAVRATNPMRPVIIGGQNYSGLDSLSTVRLPDDPNVVPTFHYYDPFPFTHQGASWVHPSPPVGRRFPLPEDYTALDASLARLKAYMAQTGRVPFMGEYGAYDSAAIAEPERVTYYRMVSRAFASVGVQSCAWGYTNTFRLRDGDHWLPGMLEGIATTTTR